MVVEKGYKQTEVGVIPEDWEVRELREIGDFKNGINKSADDFGFGFPFVNLMDVFGKNEISVKTELGLINSNNFEKATYNLISGDVLFIRSSVKPSGVGLTALVKEDMYETVYSGFLIRYRERKFLTNEFKKYCFFSERFRSDLIANSTVSANTNINQEALKKLKIGFPKNKAEQTAIANALSDMDALIAQTEKLIEKKKAIKQGVMQELLKPKEGWVTKKLGEVCEIIMGQSPLSEYYNFTGIGLPLIQGNADIKNRKTITRTYSSNITKKGKLGDIIMTVRAPVGEIAISSFECCLGRGVCALRYENDFMYHYLISMENYWSRLSSGSTFDSVNSSQIRDLPITLPGTKKEQIEIAKTLTDLDKDIELTETKLQKLKHQKQGMMQALLTGKIRLI